MPVLELLAELVPWASNITGCLCLGCEYNWLPVLEGWLAGLAGLAGQAWPRPGNEILEVWVS